MDELDCILESRGDRVDLTVCLEVDVSALQERLLDGAQLTGRSDDTEDVIAGRLRLYAHETQPILGVYRARGILRSVNGHGDVSTVAGRVLAAFALRTQVDNALR